MKVSRHGSPLVLHGNPVMSKQDSAAYCNVSIDTFDRVLRLDPDFPAGIRVTRQVIGWRQDELDKWLDARPKVPAA